MFVCGCLNRPSRPENLLLLDAPASNGHFHPNGILPEAQVPQSSLEVNIVLAPHPRCFLPSGNGLRLKSWCLHSTRITHRRIGALSRRAQKEERPCQLPRGSPTAGPNPTRYTCDSFKVRLCPSCPKQVHPVNPRSRKLHYARARGWERRRPMHIQRSECRSLLSWASCSACRFRT